MKKGKRILAWIGIALLLSMYLITFLLAIFDKSASMTMFRASFGCTILVPIMLYAYALVYKWSKDKHKEDEQSSFHSETTNGD